jgi:hypothetical protein
VALHQRRHSSLRRPCRSHRFLNCPSTAIQCRTSVDVLQVLVHINGTQAAPVRDVTFIGVGFRDAASTFMVPHGMPSGGDWGLLRSGSLLVERSEGLNVDACWFERVDGTALFLSGYNRNATVQRSEVRWRMSVD